MEFKPEAALLGAIVKFLLLIKKILVNFGGKLSYFLFQHLITTIICIYLHSFIVTILAEVFSECIELNRYGTQAKEVGLLEETAIDEDDLKTLDRPR